MIQAVERSSIQFIYLPANRDATTVTALLKGRLWQAAKWSTAFRDASYVNAGQIQSSFEEEEPSKFLLERLSKRWQQVHEADTDSKPRLRLIENRFEELVRKAEFTFTPDEEGQERHLSELSDGQRSVPYRSYSGNARNRAGSFSCLLMTAHLNRISYAVFT